MVSQQLTQINIVLIRGLSRQQAHWGEFSECLIRALAAKGLKATLFYQDLPGFGEQNHVRSPASITKIAELLQPAIAKMVAEGEQKVHLLGISMGGMVALELARRFPELCHSLVMINSSVKPISPFYQRLQPRAYKAILKAWCHPVMRQSEAAILKLSSQRYAHDDALLDKWIALRKQQPPSRRAAVQQILAAMNYHAPLDRPLEKVCLIASKQDRIASHRCTLALAKTWNVKPHVHPDAGHDLALDEPDWLSQILSGWYQQCLIAELS